MKDTMTGKKFVISVIHITQLEILIFHKLKGLQLCIKGDKNNYAWRDRVKEQREVGKRIGIYDGKVE